MEFVRKKVSMFIFNVSSVTVSQAQCYTCNSEYYESDKVSVEGKYVLMILTPEGDENRKEHRCSIIKEIRDLKGKFAFSI